MQFLHRKPTYVHVCFNQTYRGVNGIASERKGEICASAFYCFIFVKLYFRYIDVFSCVTSSAMCLDTTTYKTTFWLVIMLFLIKLFFYLLDIISSWQPLFLILILLFSQNYYYAPHATKAAFFMKLLILDLKQIV